MPRTSIIYRSQEIVVGRYRYGREFVHYAATVAIKSGGKNPVSIILKHDGPVPLAAPMPPNQHTISAPAVIELFRKLERWFRKYGYTIEV